MQSKATTVDAYLASLPEDRRRAIATVRRTILENLPKGYAEGMQYGMIGYYVPHSVYPAGYHCDPKQPLPFAALASQKNYMSLYMMCIYGDPAHAAWFREAWTKAGCRLDMGKSCVRFRKLEDVPLDVIGRATRRVPVSKYIAYYESTLGEVARRKSAAKKAPVRKKVAAKTAKKAAGKTTKKAAGRAARRTG